MDVGFCTTPDGARIAYGTLGKGPVMVLPPSYYAIIPAYKYLFQETRTMLDSLARHHTVVVYDMRGAGLSERNRTVFTLESELQDLETLINHLKLNKVILHGRGSYGPVLITYAVKYPERVTHLILYGTSAHHGKYVGEETKLAMISLLRQPDTWLAGRAFSSLGAPHIDTNQLDARAQFFKDNVDPEIAARIMDMSYKFDVTDLCPLIKCPTLVMHRQGDLFVEFKAGVELASLIPNAKFVPLEGDTHLPFLGDMQQWLHYVSEFLGDPVDDVKATKAEQPIAQKLSHDVFISFAYADKDSASKIYNCLKNNGINSFWCEDLAAGQDYPRMLGEAIRDCKAFLLVVSDSADNSDSVRKETTIAHNSKKPIIPVRIKEILPKNLEYLIANSLFFDAFSPPLDKHMPKLLADIKKIIGGKAETKAKIKK